MKRLALIIIVSFMCVGVNAHKASADLNLPTPVGSVWAWAWSDIYWDSFPNDPLGISQVELSNPDAQIAFNWDKIFEWQYTKPRTKKDGATHQDLVINEPSVYSAVGAEAGMPESNQIGSRAKIYGVAIRALPFTVTAPTDVTFRLEYHLSSDSDKAFNKQKLKALAIATLKVKPKYSKWKVDTNKLSNAGETHGFLTVTVKMSRKSGLSGIMLVKAEGFAAVVHRE